MSGVRLFGGILLLLTVTLTPSLYGQQPTVLYAGAGESGNPQLPDIVARAIRVELERVGLTAVRENPSTDQTAAEARELAAEARRRGVPYLLIFRYEVASDQMSLELSFYDVGKLRLSGASEAAALATVSTETTVDLELDARVAELTRRLIDQADPEVPGPVRRKAEEEPDGSGGTISSSGPDLPDGQARPNQDSGRKLTAEQPPEAPGKVSTSVSAAALLITGSATQYFRYGMNARLSGLYSLVAAAYSLEAGVSTGAALVFPDEGIMGNRAYLFTAGPTLGFGTSAHAPTRIAAVVSGGAAVIAINPNGTELLTKAVPYVDGGISARAHLGRAFGVGIELRYVIAFESEFPLMALAPALSVSVRL